MGLVKFLGLTAAIASVPLALISVKAAHDMEDFHKHGGVVKSQKDSNIANAFTGAGEWILGFARVTNLEAKTDSAEQKLADLGKAATTKSVDIAAQLGAKNHQNVDHFFNQHYGENPNDFHNRVITPHAKPPAASKIETANFKVEGLPAGKPMWVGSCKFSNGDLYHVNPSRIVAPKHNASGTGWIDVNDSFNKAKLNATCPVGVISVPGVEIKSTEPKSSGGSATDGASTKATPKAASASRLKGPGGVG